MADNTIKIEVTDGGSIDKLAAKGNALNNTLKKVGESAGFASKALSQASAPSKGALSQAGGNPNPTSDTNLNRGIQGTTGAAGRDFAKQAQGLGGLVHVYATFAANIFAISAAFGALSKAMDTTNLVKGLDQIGASTGKNLGSLAKQMVHAADGAISLQQAMTSTAMASAGGMTNQSILRMTEVAKKASLALGRDMTDSMDRPTKGIVKTQPELLDELGIMTRMIPAQQEYARQIGKTIGSLTDFEKRQAFANAVLAEGEKKFGAIALEANPYSKISASISNLIQVGLELVNKVLGPVANLLSQSPSGLALVLGGLASVLLKQAIPAIGMFRENAKKMEAETHARVARQVKDQQDAAAHFDSIAAAKAEKAFQLEADTIKRTEALQKASFNRKLVGSDIRASLRKNPFELTDSDIQNMRSKQEELAKSTDAAAKSQADKLKKHILGVEKIRQESTSRGDAAAEAAEKRDTAWYTHQSQQAKNLANLNKKAAQNTVLSNAADNAAVMGPVFAFKSLREETSKLDMGSVAKGVTLVKGSFSILTSAISTAVSAFGVWAQLIGLVIAGISLLDTYLSTSAKQAEAFNTSIDTLNSSFENVTRTLDVISKKDLKDFISVESTQAKANALNDLTSSLSSSVDKFFKLQEAQSGWDKFFDGFWDMFGKGSADKLALGVSTTVVDAMKLMAEGDAKEKAKKDIAALFDQPVDFENVTKFNESIKDLDKAVVGSKAKEIAKILDTASRSANNSASALTAFKTALGEVDKQATTISNSLMPVDDISKMGIALNTAAANMATALKDPIDGLTALRELASDTRALSFLPPGLAVELGTSKQKLDELSSSIALAQKEQADAKAKASKAQAELDKLGGKLSDNPLEVQTNYSDRKAAQDILTAEKERADIAAKRIEKDTSAARDIVESYKDISRELANAGFERMAQALNRSLAEAGVSAAKGYLDTIKSAGGFTAQMDAELTKQQIAIQIDDIKTRYNNTIALANLTLEVQRNTLAQDKATISREMANAVEHGKSTTELESKLKLIDKSIGEIDLAKAISKAGSGNIRSLANIANSKAADDTLRNAMGMLTDVVAQSFGKDSQLAKLYADMKNADLAAKAGKISDTANIRKQELSNTGKTLSNTASDIANIQAINGMYNEQLQLSKEINAEAQIRNKFDIESVDIQKNIEINAIALNKFRKEGKDSKGLQEAERNAAALQKSLATANLEKETQLGILASKNIQERKAGLLQLKAIQEEQDKSHRQYLLDIKAAEDITSESKLSYSKDIGSITEAEYIKQLASIKAAAEERKFQNDILNIKQEQSKEQDAIQAKIDAAEASKKDKMAKVGRGPVDTSNESAVIQQQTELLNANKTKNEEILTAKKAQNDATVASIALQAVQNAKVAEQVDQMNKMQSITESLNTIFGDMGSTLGRAAEAFAKMGQEAQRYADTEKERIALQATLDNGVSSIEAKEDAAKRLGKLELDHTKAQLDGASKVAGISKKLFGEKTAAYKILDGMEKASAALKLALEMKEMALTLKNWAVKIGLIEEETVLSVGASGTKAAASIAGETAALGPKTSGGIASLVSQGGFAGLAAVGAFLALLGSSGGSSDISVPSGVTSADRQSVQGTGMSYDANGNKVANGGGVFGDTSAKSESIKNSLELIAATTVEGMSYSNSMVKLLTSINEGIGKLSMSLYSIQGIGSGTGFGTIEATSGGNGGGLLSGLFGSSSTDTSIIDSGIQLKGTFLDLAKAGENANAVLNQFETVQTTTTRSGAFFGLFGGGGSSTSISENIKGLDQSVREEIGGIFTGAANLFIEQGNKLGEAEGVVMAKLGTINVDKLASLRGLKGEELQKELNAVVGSIMDDTAKQLFPKLDIFKKFGEGYAQTVTRVIDSNEKITLAFKQMGKPLTLLPEVASKATQQMVDDVAAAQKKLDTAKANLAASKKDTSVSNPMGYGTDTVTTTYDPKAVQDVKNSELELAEARKKVEEANKGMTVNNLKRTEALADAAGGVDKFLSLTSSFTDAYLTPVEKVGPRITAMNAEMERLGLSTGTTKDQLKSLVQNYNVTDKASAEYYVDLLKLADAYQQNSAGISEVADKLGMSSSSIKSILSDAVKNANSAEEARQLGTQGAADAIGSALQDALLTGVTNIVSQAINSIVGNLVSGSAASAVNIATGGTVAGTNMASAGAVAGANVATGGTIAASNVASGGTAAAQSMAQGGAAAANAMIQGGTGVRSIVAETVKQVKTFVSTFVEVMKDPEVQASLKELTAGFGEFAAASYSGSAAIGSLTTSIGGTSKAAAGASGGGGGAAGAANDLAKEWQSAADSIFKEVERIRGLMTGTGQQALDIAQMKFDQATALARAGDIDAAKALPQLSQALLTAAESTTSTLLDLRRIQGATQSSLETTGLGAVATYGLKLPSYDVGTNYVPQDMVAQIHEGEAIIPKAYNNSQNEALLREIQALRQEVAYLREATEDNGVYVKKTSDTLTRVTLGGDAMQTHAV